VSGPPGTRAVPALPLLVLLALGAPTPAIAFDLGSLFRTPEQRAASRVAAGEHEALVEEAPDAYWEGIGRYGAGDAAGAAEAFERALVPPEGGAARAPSARERDDLLFNRATAETRAGRLDEALALYDALLERTPTHADALHNREIARALQALEQPENRGVEGGESDTDQDSRAQESEAGGESAAGGDGAERDRPDDASSEAGSRPGEGAESDDNRSGSGAGESGEEPDGAGERGAGERSAEAEAEDAFAETPTEEDGRVAAEEASEALAAERDRDQAGERAGATPVDKATGEGERGPVRAPSEREQATEQWLRRIPDDPSGLLESRLRRSHHERYPEVGDGAEPW